MTESWYERLAASRPPDFVITGDLPTPQMNRWHLIPRNRLFNVYLHQFLRSDEDEALHDHPWLFNLSILLKGEYVERTIRAGGVNVRAERRAGQWKLRIGPAPHRVEMRENAECWTLFVTGPIVRVWGFHCENGWKPFKEFTRGRKMGKGCA